MFDMETAYYTMFMSLMCLTKATEAMEKGDEKTVRYYTQRGMLYSMLLMSRGYVSTEKK